MDATQVASLTSLLAPLLGTRTAGVVSLIMLAVFVASQAMPYLPVASATSEPWYRVTYGILARVIGSRGNNAPMPAAGDVPAGGLVPVPPALKSDAPKA